MLQFISPSDDATEIERFRARHRRLLRTQQHQNSSAKVEDLEEDDGRRRKISANWRRKQQVTHQSDSHWCQSISVGDGFNAFDFSTSPEAFHDEPETPLESCSVLQDEQRMADVARQVTSMGFHCASMWSTTGQSHWGPPTNYIPCADQRRAALYQQPQYYG
ncbi:hypothetical protein F443_11644 [Phytophthora nicotianae P1569]|uniref:Uncharacterized protein n=1 Tax=Phytophthora nicotianae P1569 TaxID=1317065 RepID=V9EY51_PHYNI|nr:hypothetical protein F443_11644 [Phytophthora nicotianae P1569]